MAGNEIDHLFRAKAAVARRGRNGMIAAICVAVLGIACAAVFGISRSLPTSASDRTAAVETPVPTVSETAQPEAAEVLSPDQLYDHEIKMVWLEGTEPEKEIQVEVLREGDVIRTLEVGPDNDWTAQWEDEYPPEELTLAGSLPPGSEVSYSLNGNSFVLTARLGQVVNVESDGNYLPKTGLRWMGVVLLSLLAGSCFISYIWVKKSQA